MCVCVSKQKCVKALSILSVSKQLQEMAQHHPLRTPVNLQQEQRISERRESTPRTAKQLLKWNVSSSHLTPRSSCQMHACVRRIDGSSLRCMPLHRLYVLKAGIHARVYCKYKCMHIYHICMYTNICVYRRVRTYAYVYIEIHIYVYVYICVHVHTYVCGCICICTGSCTRFFTYSHTHTFLVSVCSHVYTYIYIYIYIFVCIPSDAFLRGPGAGLRSGDSAGRHGSMQRWGFRAKHCLRDSKWLRVFLWDLVSGPV